MITISRQAEIPNPIFSFVDLPTDVTSLKPMIQHGHLIMHMDSALDPVQIYYAIRYPEPFLLNGRVQYPFVASATSWRKCVKRIWDGMNAADQTLTIFKTIDGRITPISEIDVDCTDLFDGLFMKPVKQKFTSKTRKL